MTDLLTKPDAAIADPVLEGRLFIDTSGDLPSTARPSASSTRPRKTVSEILTDLLQAETAHRHAAFIRYRMTATKLPVIKDLSVFVSTARPSTRA